VSRNEPFEFFEAAHRRPTSLAALGSRVERGLRTGVDEKGGAWPGSRWTGGIGSGIALRATKRVMKASGMEADEKLLTK
jgi:hypothetical protein